MPKLPAESFLSETLSALVGRDVAVGSARRPDGRPVAVFVGAYRTDAGELAALCTADLAGAASLGGALSMVPVAVVQESVGRGALSETLRENFSEILNVCALLFNGNGAEHVAFESLTTTRGQLPADVTAALGAAAARQYAISVNPYPAGLLEFRVLSRA